MTESKIPMHTCRPRGATLRKELSLKHTEIRPVDDISYVIKKYQGKSLILHSLEISMACFQTPIASIRL